MEAAPEGAQRASGRMRLGFVVAGALIVLSTAGATVGIGMMQVKHIANDLKQYGHAEHVPARHDHRAAGR